mgnify:CR=1 FL=1
MSIFTAYFPLELIIGFPSALCGILFLPQRTLHAIPFALFRRNVHAPDPARRTAARLGMTATHYANPNGLFDPRQLTTARDTGLLVSALLRDFPEYAHYFSQKAVAVGKRKLANRNALIRQMPEADGMKTGFVCNSGFNLVATATRDKRKLAAIVFGFVGCLGESAVPIIMGGVGYELLGNTITSSMDVLNYPLAAALSTIVIVLMLLLMMSWYVAFDLKTFLGKILEWRR